MRNGNLIAIVFLMVFGLVFARDAVSNPPARPFPQHVRYAEGVLLPSHRTQAQMDDDIRAAYDRWKKNHLVACGETQFRVSKGFTDKNATVSEGQGYGMVIVALMAGHDPAAREIFDGLWRYFDAHRSQGDPRFMAWRVSKEGTSAEGDANSAFDGDADIACGLLMADRQWGSDGPVNYRAEAAKSLRGLLERAIGPDTHLPMLGDWVTPGGEKRNQYSVRPSDFMPAHFRSFARETGDAAWNRVTDACQAVTTAALNSLAAQTALLPDFMILSPGNIREAKAAPARFLESEWDGCYNWNSGRIPWRIGTDAVLNGDPVSTEHARKMTRWIRTATANNPTAIRPGYQLDGNPISSRGYFSTLFAAPYGVAAMASKSQEWLNGIYDAVRAEVQGYYADTVTMQCLIVMSGNCWTP